MQLEEVGQGCAVFEVPVVFAEGFCGKQPQKYTLSHFEPTFINPRSVAQWCSNPQGCGYAAYYTGVDLPPTLEVKCKCGFLFWYLTRIFSH